MRGCAKVAVLLCLVGCVELPPPPAALSEDVGLGVDTERDSPNLDDVTGDVTPGDASDVGDAADVDADGLTDVDEGDWWDSSWQRRVRLRSSELDLVTGEEFAGFVVLVELDSTFEYEQARTDGGDLRVVDMANPTAALPHELAVWEPGGRSVLWIRLSTLSATTELAIYYGNPTASDVTDAESVWQDYGAVIRFETFEGDIADSSPSGLSGSTFGDVQASNFRGDGPFGRNIALLEGQGIDFGEAAIFDPGIGAQRTLELWFNVPPETDVETSRRYLFHRESRCKGWTAYIDDDGTLWVRYASDPVPNGEPLHCDSGYFSRQAAATSRRVDDGQWHYFVLVLDRPGSSLTPYLDGRVLSGLTIENENDASEGDMLVGVGLNEQQSIKGQLDEVRVQNGARGADWIRAQHLSMTNALWIFEAPEGRPSSR